MNPLGHMVSEILHSTCMQPDVTDECPTVNPCANPSGGEIVLLKKSRHSDPTMLQNIYHHTDTRITSPLMLSAHKELLQPRCDRRL